MKICVFVMRKCKVIERKSIVDFDFLSLIKFQITFFALFCFINGFAQMRYGNWYFGFKAGIKFSNSQVEVINDSEMNVDEGCSSISDSVGNLLFYTDGMSIWNRNHELMKNGSNLNGHYSSVQSALILKKPGSGNIFYVFTSDKVPLLKPYKDSGMCYTTVDMSLDNGKGEVVDKNIKLTDRSIEHLTATMHSNNKDYWVATIRRGSDSVYIYLLSEKGLSDPIIYKNTERIVGELNGIGGIGQMKFSQDSRVLAYISSSFGDNRIHILSFEPSTGLLSNSRDITNILNKPYGIEFSPNLKYLYVSLYQNIGLYQIDLDSVESGKDFSKISTLISKQPSDKSFGSLQLGPDNKIYLAKYKSPYLGVINNPDEKGISCNFELNGMSLQGNLSGYGLPFFELDKQPIEIIILNKVYCVGDTLQFRITGLKEYDSVKWYLNKIENYGSDILNFHFSDTGTFMIEAIIYMKGEKKLAVSRVIQLFNIQKPDIGLDRPLCNKDTLYGFFAETYIWSTGQKTSYIEILNPGTYWLQVKYKNCIQADTVVLETCEGFFYYIPNAFSPNNDGNNDFFTVIGENIRSYNLTIYNFWGERIFNDYNETVSWDGTYKQKPCQQGVYFYLIEITGYNGNTKYLSGSVSLLR